MSQTKTAQSKRLNLRLSFSEHKEIRREALERDMSAQDFALEAIRRALQKTKRREPEPISS